MSDHTHIEWTDATWNPITGCSVVSAGCKHCYAMRLAGTRLRDHPSRAGLTRQTLIGPVWTGDVRLNEDWLDQPLRWKKPRRIFVCAHGDLFHQAVPNAWIDRVFAVMALAPQHTFQVLTKRPERMLDWFQRNPYKGIIGYADIIRESRPSLCRIGISDPNVAPWPNVHLGVSVENQAAADERIPLLLDTPAAIRWISAEPLLGPLDIFNGDPDPRLAGHTATATYLGDWWEPGDGLSSAPRHGLDWVVAGGESGPGARPSHPAWFRSLRDQCQAAGVPFFFKQWGEWLPADQHAATGRLCDDEFALDDDLIGSLHDWPDGACSVHVRKKDAGRLLDGREWNQYPEARQ